MSGRRNMLVSAPSGACGQIIMDTAPTPSNKYADFLSNIFKARRIKPRVFVFSALFIVFLLIVFLYNGGNGNFTEDIIIERNRVLNDIASELVRTEVEQVFVNAILYTNDRRVIRDIERNNWSAAINLLSPLIESYISTANSLFLSDINGNVMASLPGDRDVWQKAFGPAPSDWYQGVISDWQPYLSKVYKTGSPSGNLVSVNAFAVPVLNSLSKPIAVLVLEMKPSLFDKGINTLKVDSLGGITVLDQDGKVVSTGRNDADNIAPVDLLDNAIISKVMAGSSGTIVKSPTDSNIKGIGKVIYSFNFLPEYSWGVVTAVPR